MEKFAVDLEKVLDEFEFSEEREERVALSVINNQSLPYICHVPQTRQPINNYRRPSFEPINLADADFAASPSPAVSTRLLNHQQQNNLTSSYENASITSTPSIQNTTNSDRNSLSSASSAALITTNNDKYRQQSSVDERIISNGLRHGSSSVIIDATASIAPERLLNDNNIVYKLDSKTNNISPPLSSRESVASDSSEEEEEEEEDEEEEEEETSSLSDEKPDLLDCNNLASAAIKSIGDNASGVTGIDKDSDSVDDYKNGEIDYNNLVTRLLPDVTTSSVFNKKLSQSDQEASVDSNCSNINNNNNNNNPALFDLINTNNNNNTVDICGDKDVCDVSHVNLVEKFQDENLEDSVPISEVSDSETNNSDKRNDQQLAADGSENIEVKDFDNKDNGDYLSVEVNREDELNFKDNELSFNGGKSALDFDNEKVVSSFESEKLLIEESLDINTDYHSSSLSPSQLLINNSSCSSSSSSSSNSSNSTLVEAFPKVEEAIGFKIDDDISSNDIDNNEELEKYLEEFERTHNLSDNSNQISDNNYCLNTATSTSSQFIEPIENQGFNKLNVIKNINIGDRPNVCNVDNTINDIVDINKDIKVSIVDNNLIVESHVVAEDTDRLDNSMIASQSTSDSLTSYINNDNFENENRLNVAINSCHNIGGGGGDEVKNSVIDNNLVIASDNNNIISKQESINCVNDVISVSSAVDNSINNYGSSQTSCNIVMGNSADKIITTNVVGDSSNGTNSVAIPSAVVESTATQIQNIVSKTDVVNSNYSTSDLRNEPSQQPSPLQQDNNLNVEDSEGRLLSRPNYLELPVKITVDTDGNNEETATPSTSTSPSSATTITSADGVEVCTSGVSSPLSCDLSAEECQLGKVPPFWVPDSDAMTCMQCQQRFTLVKRRHHCRACGQVLCSKCCCMKTKLVFMEGEARVCQPCYSILGNNDDDDDDKNDGGIDGDNDHDDYIDSSKNLYKLFFKYVMNNNYKANNSSAEGGNGKSPLGRQPNPNNPMEYCSTIPPLQQAAGSLHQPPPSVLVPVGVLKREGRVKSEVAKQVMFSDGIRPGGDLTELDGSGEPRLPFRRPGRLTKRVGTPPGGAVGASGSTGVGSGRVLSSLSGRRMLDPITQSFIPSSETDDNKTGLPPVVERIQGETVYSQFESMTPKGTSPDEDKPIKFAINSNLFVLIKKVTLDCCVNRDCWCVTSSGLACVGQDEVILVLECLPDEKVPPKDAFLLINMLYIDASKGNTVSELSFTPSFSSELFGSRDHGGFLYIRPSYQCTSKLILPNPPYLVALLIHKWETPWARLFPIRLVLRLGAEYRYYPCPLVSVRHRQPLYTDIGHTIINILADFRKYSYTLPTVRGLVVHMEDRQTTILLPRNGYDQVVRALNNSNDSVLAFGANLSLAADSHLVCIQSSDDENTYHTQAINIHNKPRRVTGASFVVFNGALKASGGLAGKSNIVEDGLMVQVPGDTMTALRTALRDMRDYTIRCGPHAEETVLLRWTADDTNFNIGVKSCIDGRPLDGVPSMRVHNGTDYSGQYRIIRWTEVFILQCEEVEGSGDPLDISRLSESLARATCLALVPYLDLLAAANLTTIGIRAAIHPDHVGYEAGSNSEKLPPLYMNSLDNELVAVVHQAAITCRDTPATLELVFRIMES